MIINEKYLAHIGIPHEGNTPHSGRYEWGSGEVKKPDMTVTGKKAYYKEKGFTEPEIAKALGMTIREMRARISEESNASKQYDIYRVRHMKAHGNSVSGIVAATGLSDNTVRRYLSDDKKDYKNTMSIIKDELKNAVETYKYVDVGLGAEGGIAGGVTKTRLDNAVKSLVADNEYVINKVQIPNLAAKQGKKTTMMVLSKNDGRPSNEVSKDIYNNIDSIGMLGVIHDKESAKDSYVANITPVSISSDRIEIAYESPKDGIIEIRPGVPDLSLGSNRYAQVRIAVDGTHYLKGVAIYNPDLPEGKDVRFNARYTSDYPITAPNKDDKQVLKPLKDDPLNPFGASIDYVTSYVDKDGKRKQSAVNIVNEEGTWDNWTKSLPSQFLSKQSKQLIKQQLDADMQFKYEELEEIRKLTNPEIKQAMLEDFAGACDTSAEQLRGAALPRQKTQLILPVVNMKDTEVYAPNFENGERVCLVRYPHTGTFEIPELIVNNNNPEAKKVVGMAQDAIGISKNTAKQLSGADFDGDTVVVLPNNNGAIKSTAPIKELLEFDDIKDNLYGLKDRRVSGDPTCPPKMTDRQKGTQMGLVSNLITDMTFQGASQSEIVRAVKHSQVIIDAIKHDLDYRQSYKDNNIAQLQMKYQGKATGGSATIVSRSTGDATILERRGYSKINKETGELEYTNSNKTHYVLSAASKKQQSAKDLYDQGMDIDNIAKQLNISTKTATTYVNTEQKKDWKETNNMDRIAKMQLVKDARNLMSGYDISTTGGILNTTRNTTKPEGIDKEYIYADYANKCKALANEARKEAVNMKGTTYSKEARDKYSDEVAKITAEIHEIEKNKPIERHAQAIANMRLKSVLEANPDYKNDKDKMKKEKRRAVEYGRSIAGSKAGQIKLTDREFEAILAGAFSSNAIKKIIEYSDSDHFKSLATPKSTVELSDAKINRIKTLARSGATYSEIAKSIGCSTTVVSNIINNN